MDARRWLEELRRELSRRKLPPSYLERFISELSDHLNDFMEDRMSTDAFDLGDAVRPMGLPVQIADAAAAEYRKGRFAGRHPIVAFVGMPMVVLPLLWAGFVVGAIMLVGIVAWCVGTQDAAIRGPMPTWGDVSLRLLFQGIVLLPIVISAAVFCRLASRAAVSWKWPMLACLLLAVFGSLGVADMALPTTTSQGRFTFGFGMSERPRALQIIQFALPLVIGGWATWRQTSRRREAMAA